MEKNMSTLKFYKCKEKIIVLLYKDKHLYLNRIIMSTLQMRFILHKHCQFPKMKTSQICMSECANKTNVPQMSQTFHARQTLIHLIINDLFDRLAATFTCAEESCTAVCERHFCTNGNTQERPGS